MAANNKEVLASHADIQGISVCDVASLQSQELEYTVGGS